MKLGICVTYEYDGDETVWADLVGGFVNSVSADPDLKGKFTYHVQKAKDGPGRVHIGRWDRPETVALLQSKDYFKSFAKGLQELAGDSLKPMPFEVTHST